MIGLVIATAVMIWLLIEAARWPIGGSIVMGESSVGVGQDRLDAERKRLALAQYKWSFILVIASGGVALTLWAGAVGFQLFGVRSATAGKVAAGILLVGSSTLFGYFIRIWRECRREIRR